MTATALGSAQVSTAVRWRTVAVVQHECFAHLMSEHRLYHRRMGPQGVLWIVDAANSIDPAKLSW